MKNSSRLVDFALVGTLFIMIAAPSYGAIALPSLGSAAGYPILDTNTANTAAKADAAAAYNELVAMSCAADMTGKDLNNQRLAPGSYCFTTPTVLNGQVILDAAGDSNAVFIFKMNSRFDVWQNSIVMLAGGARPENVFWAVGGPVTLGVNVQFSGTIIAMNSIMLGGGAAGSAFDDHGTVNGRVWSVTNTVSVPTRVTVGFRQYPYEPSYQPTYGSSQPAAGGAYGYLAVSSNDQNFALFINGARVENNRPYALHPGGYVVSEVNISNADYGAPSFSGGCAENGLTGSVILSAGEQKTCVITNTLAGQGIWFPGMPNTGFGPGTASYLPIFNMIGLMLVTAFVWQETAYGKASS